MAEFGVEGVEVRMALTYGPTLIARGGYPSAQRLYALTTRASQPSKTYGIWVLVAAQ